MFRKICDDDKDYLERVVKVTVVINERIPPSYTMDVTRNTTWVQSHTFDSSTCVPYTHTRYSYMNGFSKQEEESLIAIHPRRRLFMPNLPHTHTHTYTYTHTIKNPCPGKFCPLPRPYFHPILFLNAMKKRKKKSLPKAPSLCDIPSWS